MKYFLTVTDTNIFQNCNYKGASPVPDSLQDTLVMMVEPM